jgi:lysozyme family protein
MLPESDIQQVITNILKREGGNVDDPLDNGGETHFGVTIPFAGQWQIPWPPTLADARDGYRRMLAGTRIDQIPDLATLDLVADSAVNHGARTAIKWMQLSLGTYADGVIGPITLALMNTIGKDFEHWQIIHKTILEDRLKLYAAIVVNDQSQAKFLVGWINRACEFLT